MHRRQYLPHSDDKLSRAQLRADRLRLVRTIERAQADAAAERKARLQAERDAADATFASKLRRFVGKAKAALTTPIRIGGKR